MSVYEPDVVRKLLSALEPKDSQKKFEASWKNMVSMQGSPPICQDKDRLKCTTTRSKNVLSHGQDMLSA